MTNIDVSRLATNMYMLNSLNSLQTVNPFLVAQQAPLTTLRPISPANGSSSISISATFDQRRESLKTALQGIGDAKKAMSTTENGLVKMQDILTKMSKLTAQGGETAGTNEREKVNAQLQAYRDQLNDIVQQTQSNGKGLLSGAKGKGKSEALQISGTDLGTGVTDIGSFSFTQGKGSANTGTNGATGGGDLAINAHQGFNASAGTNNGKSVSAEGLGLSDQALKITATKDKNGVTTTNAGDVAKSITAALNAVKAGINQVDKFTSRLTLKEEVLAVQNTKTEDAYQRIVNSSMAQQMAKYTKLSILQQTATALLAQANASPQSLFQLFR